jgi:pilus assembly protein Flp/PilA
MAAAKLSKMEGNDSMKNLLARLWKEEEGQDLTEYGLLLVLIALAAIATMKSLGSAINNVFSSASASLGS